VAQHDYIIANQSGAAFRADLNNGLAAIVSQNSGATQPSTTYAYQWWADTTTGLLKIRNAANNAWITVGTLADANLGLLSLAGGTLTGALLLDDSGTVSAPALAFDGDANTGIFSSAADTLNVATNGIENAEFGTTEVVFNDGGADVDFRVEGDTEANLFFVDAGNDEVSFRDDVKIDSSGRLLVGTSSSLGNGILQARANTDSGTGEGIVIIGKGDAATAGQTLGQIKFTNSTGNQAAYITAIADTGWGGAGSSDYPGALLFSTTADGASSPTERLRISSDGSMSAVIPGGSTLYPAFTCRAWVNFDGTGTPAIRASGNVSSITDIAAGTYTVNLTTSLTDANYSAQVTSGFASGVREDVLGFVYTDAPYAMTASACTVKFVRADTNVAVDTNFAMVAIFR
jgi:hypothetical protein